MAGATTEDFVRDGMWERVAFISSELFNSFFKIVTFPAGAKVEVFLLFEAFGDLSRGVFFFF